MWAAKLHCSKLFSLFIDTEQVVRCNLLFISYNRIKLTLFAVDMKLAIILKNVVVEPESGVTMLMQYSWQL